MSVEKLKRRLSRARIRRHNHRRRGWHHTFARLLRTEMNVAWRSMKRSMSMVAYGSRW